MGHVLLQYVELPECNSHPLGPAQKKSLIPFIQPIADAGRVRELGPEVIQQAPSKAV